MILLIYAFALSALFIFFSFLIEWIERKIVARIQSRIGPFFAGPRGLLQPLADFLKLMSKEDIVPIGADELLLTIIPILLASLATFVLMFIPIFTPDPLISYPADLIYIIGLSASIGALIVMTGYINPGPYSNVGAARFGELFLSFEIPFAVSVAVPAIISGSASIAEIVKFQENGIPIIVFAPLGFILLLISLIAKVEKVPFDIAEAETEIAGGWQVELSGRRLAFYRLTMNLETLFAAALCVALYLGAGYGPLLDTLGSAMYFVWFFIKLILVVFVISLIEGIMARLRVDQVLRIFWRYMVPLSFLQLILALFVRLIITL